MAPGGKVPTEFEYEYAAAIGVLYFDVRSESTSMIQHMVIQLERIAIIARCDLLV